jgi:hypothetical protein
VRQPDVVAVLTAADMAADGHKGWAIPAKLPSVRGGFSVETPKLLLVRDKVRFLGEPIAIVLTKTEDAVQDAAALVKVEYSEEPVVQDPFAAAKLDAPQLWPDRPGNLAYHWQSGGADGVAEARASSHHVTRLKSHVSRVCSMPMEPCAALAFIDEDGRPVLPLAHQAPHLMRNYLAACFGLDRKGVRVGMVIYSSGFLETGDARMTEQQHRMVEIARRSGMHILGPNTVGAINFVEGTGITFMQGTAELPPRRSGPIGLAADHLAMQAEPPASVQGITPDILEKVWPILADISPNIVNCGEIGNGCVAKLVNKCRGRCHQHDQDSGGFGIARLRSRPAEQQFSYQKHMDGVIGIDGVIGMQFAAVCTVGRGLPRLAERNRRSTIKSCSKHRLAERSWAQ